MRPREGQVTVFINLTKSESTVHTTDSSRGHSNKANGLLSVELIAAIEFQGTPQGTSGGADVPPLA